MAPEIALCQPYDSKCDVFSFAILLWEIFSLKTAFKGYKIPDYLGRVVRGNERPPLPKKIRPLTKLVVKESWDHDPTKRPDMKRVASMIRGDLNDMSDDTSVQNRTKHMCDRSRQSFRLNQRVQYKAYDQMVKPLGFRLSQRAQSE
jgi:Protein tyrosine and serine/threonine kinase